MSQGAALVAWRRRYLGRIRTDGEAPIPRPIDGGGVGRRRPRIAGTAATGGATPWLPNGQTDRVRPAASVRDHSALGSANASMRIGLFAAAFFFAQDGLPGLDDVVDPTSSSGMVNCMGLGLNNGGGPRVPLASR